MIHRKMYWYINCAIACLSAATSHAADSASGMASTTKSSSGLVAKRFPANPLESGGKLEQVAVTVSAGKEKMRSFTLTSTQQQRDDKEKVRVINEEGAQPRVATQNPLFDALFAMAIDDMRQASVNAIRDSAYNNGESIGCECFETGEKWNYVWTRDLAYAANLGLANLDVQRVMNGMLFKISGFRAGVKVPADLPADSLQILQDTGSGGSWPVSSDRVSWAIAVENVLQNLQGEARAQFAAKAYAALKGTVEADRIAVFDPAMGLYGGEQSYLDWRTQTYAPWIIKNLSRMSESKAHSTNVLHFIALQITAKLAREQGDTALASKYEDWATQLKANVNRQFWLADVGLYATITTSAQDTIPIYKYDMLGNALAILYGVASPEQTQKIIASYPQTPFGVPVYYPQQPNVYVYHNRSMWPFVTAYAMKAAVAADNYRAVDNAIASLVRGSALHLSNMENLEWLTGKAFYDDGPAINSRRQLWSIGAYTGMVMETIFGVRYEERGLNIKPYLTVATVELLGQGKEARLENVNYKNHKVVVSLQLPSLQPVAAGHYQLARVELNGKEVQGVISEAMLNNPVNTIRVSFGELDKRDQTITMAPHVDPLSHNDARVFAPEAPVSVKAELVQGKYLVSFEDGSGKANADIRYNLFKNGKLVAKKIEDRHWQDNEKANIDLRNCFAVEAQYLSSGHKSHHSEPYCLDGKLSQTIPVTDKRVLSNLVPVKDPHLAAPVLLEWGLSGDSLALRDVKIPADGLYAIQLQYNNRQHTIDSGVTNAVKTLEILDAKGKLAGRSVVQMPNVQDQGELYPLKSSTETKVRLAKGNYTLVLGDYFNMSYLQSNNTYKGSGGLSGPVNKASIAGFIISKIE